MSWFHLFPTQCPFCHAWPIYNGDILICHNCYEHHAANQIKSPRCERCALPLAATSRLCGLCLRKPPPLQTCLSAVNYEHPWIQCIAQFKYSKQPAWARTFAAICLAQQGVKPLLQQANWVLPIPLSQQRLRERGYNQAWEICKSLCHQYAIEGQYSPNILLRQQSGPPQAGLKRLERLVNLRRAFTLAKDKQNKILKQHVVLIDDVMTTGATLHAAAEVLIQSKAASVSAIVFARTQIQ